MQERSLLLCNISDHENSYTREGYDEIISIDNKNNNNNKKNNNIITPKEEDTPTRQVLPAIASQGIFHVTSFFLYERRTRQRKELALYSSFWWKREFPSE
mmetsp:Transcript_13521/g.19501  ORF Transcript_13521/g.19501 Transcript_13521/m.19501 type:complete len:100 (-) Transcript_13521:47-346(-)